MASREWMYDRQSHIGQLAKGLDEAKAKGWTAVSMKDDWRRIFPLTASLPGVCLLQRHPEFSPKRLPRRRSVVESAGFWSRKILCNRLPAFLQ